MYTVILKKKAQKQFNHLQKNDQKRILETLHQLQHLPFSGKKLDGDLDGLWSIRVWPFRIIYSVEKKKVLVTVLSIGHRKDVYKKV